jgi:hypothetical protein
MPGGFRPSRHQQGAAPPRTLWVAAYAVGRVDQDNGGLVQATSQCRLHNGLRAAKLLCCVLDLEASATKNKISYKIVDRFDAVAPLQTRLGLLLRSDRLPNPPHAVFTGDPDAACQLRACPRSHHLPTQQSLHQSQARASTPCRTHHRKGV